MSVRAFTCSQTKTIHLLKPPGKKPFNHAARMYFLKGICRHPEPVKHTPRKTRNMKHDYTVHSKPIDGILHYFVKKLMVFPELGEAASITAGYGMHADFDKACDIAGVDDPEARKKLRAQVSTVQPAAPETAPAPAKKPVIVIADTINKWLAESGVIALN